MPNKQEEKPKCAEDFIRVIGNNVVNDPIFKTTRHRTRFEVKKIEEASNPTDILKECFAIAIEQAQNACKKAIGFPDKFGLRLFTERLEYAMWIPVGTMTSNTIDSMMNRFNMVNQSAKPGTILGAPFTVEVTCVCEEELARFYAGQSRQYMPGRGRVMKRKAEDKKNDISYAYHDDGLIKIDNLDDGYCLFHACEMARLEKTERDRNKFFRYKNDYDQQLENALALIDAIGAPRNLTSYDAADWLQRIQAFYDQQYPEQFRIFIFGRFGQYKPKMKTGALSNLHTLCLYYDNNHYDVIPRITRFFASVESYCFACEAPYKDKLKHRLKCEVLCILCRGLFI